MANIIQKLRDLKEDLKRIRELLIKNLEKSSDTWDDVDSTMENANNILKDLGKVTRKLKDIDIEKTIQNAIKKELGLLKKFTFKLLMLIVVIMFLFGLALGVLLA